MYTEGIKYILKFYYYYLEYYSLLEHLSFFLSLATEEYICHEQFEIVSLPDDNYFIELLNGMEVIDVLPLTILVFIHFIYILFSVLFILFFTNSVKI